MVNDHQSSWCLRKVGEMAGPGCVIAGLTLIEFTLANLVPPRFMPLKAGAGLVAYFFLVTLLWWTTVVWFVFGYTSLIRASLKRLPGRRTILAAAAIAAVALGFLATIYCACWGFCIRTGNLPDADVLQFILLNADMLGKYFRQTEPKALLQIAAIWLVSQLACTGVLYYLLRRAKTRSLRSELATFVFMLFVSCNLIIGPIAFDEPESTPQNRALASKRPQSNATYLMTHRLNPVIALCRGWILQDTSGQDEEISLGALIPRTGPATPPRISNTGQRPPNILVIVVESLRADVVGMSHQGQEVIPNINRLSREGILFTRSYAQSVHSDYSDPCLVSSLYPLRSRGHYFYERHVAWPKQLLWDAVQPGYSTALVSSQNEAWSNMHLFYESPNLDLLFDARSAPELSFLPEGDASFHDWANDTGLAGKLNDRLTAATAIRWITEREADSRPWLCVVNFQTSHFPYQLPRGETGRFQPCKINFEASLFDWDKRHSGTVWNAYLSALRYIDDRVGEIRKSIDELTADSRTIIVVTGDHGEAMGEIDEFGHAQSLIETVCRVPLIVHAPGRIPPGRSDDLAQGIDVAPSVLGLAGFAPNPAFQGINLFDDNIAPPGRRLVFLHSRAGGVGADAVVADCGWKLIAPMDSTDVTLQFRPTDLVSSPDLSSEYPEVAGILHTCLIQWRRQQLAYYREPRYHKLFFAPRSPELPESAAEILVRAAESITGQQQQMKSSAERDP